VGEHDDKSRRRPLPPGVRGIMPVRLTAQREHKGWKQPEAAEHLGVPPGTYASWEQGVAFPPPEILAKLPAVFGMPLGYFFGHPIAFSEVATRIATKVDQILSPDIREFLEDMTDSQLEVDRRFQGRTAS